VRRSSSGPQRTTHPRLDISDARMDVAEFISS